MFAAPDPKIIESLQCHFNVHDEMADLFYITDLWSTYKLKLEQTLENYKLCGNAIEPEL